MDLHFSFQKYRGSCDRTKIKLNKKGKGIISALVIGCWTAHAAFVPFPSLITMPQSACAELLMWDLGYPAQGAATCQVSPRRGSFGKRWLPFSSATKVSALAGGAFTIGPTTTAVGVQRLGVVVLHWHCFARKTQSERWNTSPSCSKMLSLRFMSSWMKAR